MVVSLYVLASILINSAKELPDLSKIPTPPSFIHQPNPTNLYFVVEDTRENDAISSAREKKFNCEATGFPKVNYRWLKDKKELNVSELISTGRLTKVPGTGSIILSKLQKSDAGEYQCLADNDNGTAVDKPIYFEQSRKRGIFIGKCVTTFRFEYLDTLMELFPPEPVETIRIDFGNAFHRECRAPMSVPAARPYWVLLSLPGTDRRTFRTINSTNIVVNDKMNPIDKYHPSTDIQ
uniref:Ig-like domain-containing protein n=1 Tax=Romanomermis culicivorax TaxID=13658 RepID=A0A915KY07_ROMCU